MPGFFRQFRNRSANPPTFHTSEYGNYYAKLPIIDADNTSLLLRAILTKDLDCGDITEISGDGDTWWDFKYKGTKFTCQLLVEQCCGSDLYPTSCTQSTGPERELLRQLVGEITRHAIERMS